MQQLHSSKTNMTTDMAVNVARDFLKQMAQPWTQVKQFRNFLLILFFKKNRFYIYIERLIN